MDPSLSGRSMFLDLWQGVETFWEYTRNCLKKAHTTIYLVDSSSGRVFRSPIFTSSKHDEDKFIYSGWIRFVKANSLRFKDKVVLNAKHGNNVLDVHIIRGSQSS
ncbi:hypothetical protein P8452_70939 [Trifolium repens]|nr:hypothetical protein P8452_70939 [Trifolium repens]